MISWLSCAGCSTILQDAQEPNLCQLTGRVQSVATYVVCRCCRLSVGPTALRVRFQVQAKFGGTHCLIWAQVAPGLLCSSPVAGPVVAVKIGLVECLRKCLARHCRGVFLLACYRLLRHLGSVNSVDASEAGVGNCTSFVNWAAEWRRSLAWSCLPGV